MESEKCRIDSTLIDVSAFGSRPKWAHTVIYVLNFNHFECTWWRCFTYNICAFEINYDSLCNGNVRMERKKSKKYKAIRKISLFCLYRFCVFPFYVPFSVYRIFEPYLFSPRWVLKWLNWYYASYNIWYFLG